MVNFHNWQAKRKLNWSAVPAAIHPLPESLICPIPMHGEAGPRFACLDGQFKDEQVVSVYERCHTCLLATMRFRKMHARSLKHADNIIEAIGL